MKSASRSVKSIYFITVDSTCYIDYEAALQKIFYLYVVDPSLRLSDYEVAGQNCKILFIELIL